MIISYDYELCFIGLIILWIRHCNCTAACGRLCRPVVHFENSSSCLKFAFTQTFVKEALCNITCRSAIYLKFHGLFPNNQLWKQLSCVLLVCYSIRLQLGHQFNRAHLGHHNRFQRRCTLHVLSEVDKHSPSWALTDRQLRIDLFCCSWNTSCHTPDSFPVRDDPRSICTLCSKGLWLPACGIWSPLAIAIAGWSFIL